MNQPASNNHHISINNRQTIEISEVSYVIGCDESFIALDTSCGLLNIEGEKLEIKRFDAQSGQLSVVGFVGALIYKNEQPVQKSGLFSRLFK